MHNNVAHHVSLRRRIYKNLEQYPHPERKKRIVDSAAYVMGVLTPLTSLPQLYEIWILKNSAGVSVSTWSLWIGTSAFWFYYGFIHKERPIMVAQSLWFVLELLVVIGVLINR